MIQKKYLIFDLDGTLIKSNKFGIKNALHYVKRIDSTYIEKAKYVFQNTAGMNIYDQLKLIFDDKNLSEKEIKKYGDKIYKRIRTKEDKVHFFEGVPEKIKELSLRYKLFLTTGNSTKFAKDILKNGGIEKHFELIYGSEKIKKGQEHLNIFKDYSENNFFFKESIYLGDGEMDKIYANEAGIDFIRICDHEEENNFVLDNVANIDNILKNIGKKING